MDDAMELAGRLGSLLADHPRTKALRTATAAVEADAEARRLQEEYAHAAETLHGLEHEGRPVEPEQKRLVATLADRVRRCAPLQRLLKAHADFAELMEGVQRAIGGAVDDALGHGDGGEPAAPQSPTILTP